MYNCARKVNALAKECIDLIQECDNFEEAKDLFNDYGYEIKSYGGGLEWFMDENGKEKFKVIQPKEQ